MDRSHANKAALTSDLVGDTHHQCRWWCSVVLQLLPQSLLLMHAVATKPGVSCLAIRSAWWRQQQHGSFPTSTTPAHCQAAEGAPLLCGH